jgi:hypothetical protein
MIQFRTWLKRQIDRNDPIGDLAHDFVQSQCSDIYEAVGDGPAYTALLSAAQEYNRFKASSSTSEEVKA